MTPTLRPKEGQPVESIDAILWLVGGAIFTAGVIVGAVGVALIGMMGKVSRWERQRGLTR